jgi:hypothetical protein
MCTIHAGRGYDTAPTGYLYSNHFLPKGMPKVVTLYKFNMLSNEITITTTISWTWVSWPVPVTKLQFIGLFNECPVFLFPDG